jgi:hypothetical protein
MEVAHRQCRSMNSGRFVRYSNHEFPHALKYRHCHCVGNGSDYIIFLFFINKIDIRKEVRYGRKKFTSNVSLTRMKLGCLRLTWLHCYVVHRVL